jgi:hypothetical protein
MKTLQEQYNLIKKGKGHKGVFLKEAKRLFPNIVPNAAEFKQASKLLKQRSIISENIFPLIPSSGLNPFTTFDKFVNEEAKATETKTTKEVEEAETAGYDYKDPKNTNNQIFDQYLNGLRFEMEQNLELLADNPSEALLKAKDIVAKNLAKDSLYYMKNAAFGIKDLGYTESAPAHDQPTGKHKSSGYGDLKENKMNKSTQLKELLEEAVAGIPSIGNPFADRKTKTYEDKFAAFLAEEKEVKEGDTDYDRAKDSKGYGKKGEENTYGAGVAKGEKIEKAKMKKEEKEPKKGGMGKKSQPKDFIKEVEKLSERAANEVAVKAYQGKMNSLQETLGRINEDENLAEFIDKAKTAEVQAEIALYEKYCNEAMSKLEYSKNNQ